MTPDLSFPDSWKPRPLRLTAEYVCERCKQEGKAPFTVPADEIGIALMKEHLRDKHGVSNL